MRETLVFLVLRTWTLTILHEISCAAQGMGISLCELLSVFIVLCLQSFLHHRSPWKSCHHSLISQVSPKSLSISKRIYFLYNPLLHKNVYKEKESLGKHLCFTFILCTHLHATSIAGESEQMKLQVTATLSNSNGHPNYS